MITAIIQYFLNKIIGCVRVRDRLALSLSVKAENYLSDFNVFNSKIYLGFLILEFCTTILVYLKTLSLFIKVISKEPPELKGRKGS
jgi:hypothetical protein